MVFVQDESINSIHSIYTSDGSPNNPPSPLSCAIQLPPHLPGMLFASNCHEWMEKQRISENEVNILQKVCIDKFIKCIMHYSENIQIKLTSITTYIIYLSN